MGTKRIPFAHVVTVTAVTGTNILQHDRVGSGRYYCYQHVGVVNETNNYTRLRLIVRNGGEDQLLIEEQAPVADVLYWSDEEYYLIENDTLTAELTGCTADDLIKLHVRGYLIDQREGD